MNIYIPVVIGTFLIGQIEPLTSRTVLLPPYLVGFVIGLIVLTGITIFLRLGVYQHLISLANRVRGLIYQDTRVKKPRIVEEIEIRCQEASPNLERLNTGALIDQVYSRHLLKNEQLDYFCRFLPNLLLALGLLGTFLGITMNLSQLSQTINEFGVGSIDGLVEQVQKPLQGMGVAFISSLTAVACSALLTVVNLLRNTAIAKYQLVSALEDYIDNIYGPALNKRSPLDKAVDRLQNFFEDFFTTRFSLSVKEAVASSLGQKVDQIAEGNRQANHLATQVYNRLMESSSSMMSGATMFRESAQVFERSQFANQLSSATENLSITQKDLARSASVLNQSTQALQLAIASLQSTSQEIIHLSEEVSTVTKNSSQVLSLTQTNQQSFANVLGEMQQSAQIFHSVLVTLDTLQKRLAARTDRFVDVHSELSQLVAALKIFTEQMRTGMQKLGDRLIASMNEGVNHPQARTVSARISQLGTDLNSVQSQLAQIVQTLEPQEQSEMAPTRLSPPNQPNSSNPFNTPQLVNWEEEDTNEESKEG